MALLFISDAARAAVWADAFAEAGEDMIVGEAAVTDPAAITHLMCWKPPQDLLRYPNLRVVISAGAGVDQMPKLPEGVDLVRAIDPGIEEMVRDWVVMATLMLHRTMPVYLAQAQQGLWKAQAGKHAKDTRVGIMGMGRIGTLAAQTLGSMGFRISGWSRSGRAVAGAQVFGAQQMDVFLEQSDILVCLLPLTRETRGILNADLFARLPEAAALVHAGRGAQLDMQALREALDSGALSSAMLDVTDPEPLPADHWAWRDPRVIVTPHVAAATDHHAGAMHALSVIRATRDNSPLPGRIDQNRGY
jgi:glyoxylate/hydroxypyruvate reductase A